MGKDDASLATWKLTAVILLFYFGALTSIFEFLVASLDNLIRQIGIKSRSIMIEKCSAERDPTQVDEGENGSVLGCKQVLCVHLWGYYFECKNMAEVLSYLVQLNYL